MANSLNELHTKIQNDNLAAVSVALQQATAEMLNAPIGIARKTSLHIAAEYASPEIIKLLLEHGASTDLADLNKDYPLHILVSRQFDEKRPLQKEKHFQDLKQSLTHFKSHGANFDVRDGTNRNAAHIAITYNNALILPELIENGTDLNGEDRTHSTPLYYFVQKYGTDNEGYERLIAAGAQQSEHIQPLVFNERRQTRTGTFPLTSLSVVQDVADTSFDEVTLTNFASESTMRSQIFPLHIVMSQKDVDAPSIIKFLDGIGCLLSKDSSGRTPLDCAFDSHNFNQFTDIALIPEVTKEILLSCNRLKSTVREDTWNALMSIDSLKIEIEPKLTRINNAIKNVENTVKSTDNSNPSEQKVFPPSKRLKEDSKASQSASLFNSKVTPLVKSITQANEKFYNILLKQVDSNTNKSAILTAVVTQLENTDSNQIKDKDFFQRCVNELKNIIQPSLETSMTTTL